MQYLLFDMFVICDIFDTAWINSRKHACSLLLTVIYRKIPKISPGAFIFQRPFLRGLFLEGLICDLLQENVH